MIILVFSHKNTYLSSLLIINESFPSEHRSRNSSCFLSSFKDTICKIIIQFGKLFTIYMHKTKKQFFMRMLLVISDPILSKITLILPSHALKTFHQSQSPNTMPPSAPIFILITHFIPQGMMVQVVRWESFANQVVNVDTYIFHICGDMNEN